MSVRHANAQDVEDALKPLALANALDRYDSAMDRRKSFEAEISKRNEIVASILTVIATYDPTTFFFIIEQAERLRSELDET
jgi:hypothetical protein